MATITSAITNGGGVVYLVTSGSPNSGGGTDANIGSIATDKNTGDFYTKIGNGLSDWMLLGATVNPNISVATDTIFLEVQSGMTNLNSLYTVDVNSFDRYRISAIVPKTSMSGNNTYVFYLGTVFDPDNTLTFKVYDNNSVVNSFDPSLKECHTALSPSALVYDTVSGFVAPVSLMAINTDNSLDTQFYDIFLLAGNTNIFEAEVYVDFEFYILAGTAITFTN